MAHFEAVLSKFEGGFGYIIERNGTQIVWQMSDPEAPGNEPMTAERAREAAAAEIAFRKSLEASLDNPAAT